MTITKTLCDACGSEDRDIMPKFIPQDEFFNGGDRDLCRSCAYSYAQAGLYWIKQKRITAGLDKPEK